MLMHCAFAFPYRLAPAEVAEFFRLLFFCEHKRLNRSRGFLRLKKGNYKAG